MAPDFDPFGFSPADGQLLPDGPMVALRAGGFQGGQLKPPRAAAATVPAAAVQAAFDLQRWPPASRQSRHSGSRAGDPAAGPRRFGRTGGGVRKRRVAAA